MCQNLVNNVNPDEYDPMDSMTCGFHYVLDFSPHEYQPLDKADADRGKVEKTLT